MSEEKGCLVFFPNGQENYTVEAPFALRDLHGIAYVNDSLWATCCFDNQIAIMRNGTWSRWHPTGALEGSADTNHFNTILSEKGKIYILAHNLGQSEVLEFDSETLLLEQFYKLGNCAHNIWFDDGELRVCSSKEGKIVGLRGFSLETGGFPRGYACDSTCRLVGITPHSVRSERDSASSSLLLLDMDYRYTRYFKLPNQGMVLDIFPISEEEWAYLETEHKLEAASVIGVPCMPTGITAASVAGPQVFESSDRLVERLLLERKIADGVKIQASWVNPLPDEAWNLFRLQIISAPTRVRPSASFDALVNVTNKSRFLVSTRSPNPVNLSYHWLDFATGQCLVHDGERSEISPYLAPGESRIFLVTVKAPEGGGNYVLRFALVQEQITWSDRNETGAFSDLSLVVG
jgi:hypothetical protein